jgi:hypothetical protein
MGKVRENAHRAAVRRADVDSSSAAPCRALMDVLCEQSLIGIGPLEAHYLNLDGSASADARF